jgi:hypothetical protein
LKFETLGTTLGHEPPIVESSSSPLSLAAWSATLNFFANCGVPQP